MTIKVDPNRVVRICDAALLMLDEMAEDIEAFCLPLEADYAARQAKADEEKKAEREKYEAAWDDYHRARRVWEGSSSWFRGASPSPPTVSLSYTGHIVSNESPRGYIQALRRRIEAMRSLGRMAVGYFDVDTGNARALDWWEQGKHQEHVRALISPKVEA